MDNQNVALEPEKHVCGQCQMEFGTVDEYLDHECEKTGFTPRDPEHMGEEFEAVSKAALERGEEQKKAASKKSK